MTLEEKKEQVKKFQDLLMIRFWSNWQMILVYASGDAAWSFLGDEKLIVKDVIVQRSRETLYGRSVRLMHSVSLEMEKV